MQDETLASECKTQQHWPKLILRKSGKIKTIKINNKAFSRYIISRKAARISRFEAIKVQKEHSAMTRAGKLMS